MSKLAGVFYSDSRPISRRERAWASDALGIADPCSASLEHEPGLLMGCAVEAFDRRVRSPELSCGGPGICTWDGRLDNRDDLLLEFGRGLEKGTPDNTFALKLYQAKGVDGLRDLIGDWSLALWDAASRTVVLASDYAGIRPLYYRCAPGCVVWSSSLSDLVRHAGTTDLDEDYVASFLRYSRAWHRTPYRGIYPVPPGQAVCISAAGIVTRRFWSLPIDQDIRFSQPRSYEEQLRVLFREAVAVRLRTDLPVCAELSGGLDSSSVVAMADQVMAAQSAEIANTVTFSYTHPGCPDERYFRTVEDARGLPGIHLELDEVPFVAAGLVGNAAPAWWQPRFRELARRMSKMGSSVFLTGQLGDFTMGNAIDDCEQVADHLAQRHFASAAREAFAWSQTLQVPIYPILWRALRTTYSAWTASPGPDSATSITSRYAAVDSLTPELRNRSGYPGSAPQCDSTWQSASPGRRRRFRALSDMLEARILQAPEDLRHISYTHPFAHRPLVEFMLTIPPAVVCRSGEPRRLMRRAFAGLLPAAIVNRQSKAGYGGMYRKALLPLANEMLRNTGKMQLVERGFVDRASITERLSAFANGLDCNENQLRPIILFEFWLRRQGQSAGEAPHPAAA